MLDYRLKKKIEVLFNINEDLSGFKNLTGLEYFK